MQWSSLNINLKVKKMLPVGAIWGTQAFCKKILCSTYYKGNDLRKLRTILAVLETRLAMELKLDTNEKMTTSSFSTWVIRSLNCWPGGGGGMKRERGGHLSAGKRNGRFYLALILS